MNGALLVILCGLITGLTTALVCVALGKLIDFEEDKQEGKEE